MSQTTLKRRKKHALTLLELTIAFFLVGILLSSLWGTYRSWLVTQQKNQIKQTQLYTQLFLKTRIDKLCSLVSNSDDKISPVYTPLGKEEGHSAVCFSYINAPDPNPYFNGKVKSLLYINSQNQLCLATWSQDKTPRIEILLSSVKRYALAFFDPHTNTWREDWPESIKHSPLWMKLYFQPSAPPLVFRLSTLKDPIVFVEGGNS